MLHLKRFLVGLVAVSLILACGDGGKAAVIEDFSSDPIPGGRFIQITGGTESSFTYNSAAQNLTAVLDNDNASAYYLSNSFPAVTDMGHAFFRMDFRITAVDVVEDAPLGLFGLMTSQHVNDYGDGLMAEFSSSVAGQVRVSARIDDSAFKVYGTPFNLALNTDYYLFGSYSPVTRTLDVEVFSGATLVGTSSATHPGGGTLSVDRVGFQNYGRVVVDRSVDSITLTVDNISNEVEVPEPSAVALLSTGSSLLFMAWRRRKRSP